MVNTGRNDKMCNMSRNTKKNAKEVMYEGHVYYFSLPTLLVIMNGKALYNVFFLLTFFCCGLTKYIRGATRARIQKLDQLDPLDQLDHQVDQLDHQLDQLDQLDHIEIEKV